MKASNRVEQYALDVSDDQLVRMLSVHPVPVDLLVPDPSVRATLLSKALGEVFVPDSQTCSLLKEILGMAKAHALAYLDSDADYLSGVYSKQPWGGSRQAAICFTGIQGVGKSQLLRALGRILLGRSGRFNVKGHHNVDRVPLWWMTLAKGDGLNQLLRGFLDPHWGKELESESVLEPVQKSWSVPKILGLAERRSWLNATCLAAIDEFQWISAGSTSNARAASVLLKLQSIGPRLLFCANFSLVHKLKSRPPEDRDRLLSVPLIMHPFGKEDSDLVEYLRELKKVAPDVLLFDPENDVDQIYLYTFGVRRKIVDLLVAAYKIGCRSSKVGHVGSQDLLLAYRSDLYTTHREDVETLFRQQVTGRVERPNLWCPFGTSDVVRTNVVEATKLVHAFEKRVEDALLASALLPEEAAALAVIDPPAEATAKPAKVLRFNRTKVTKAGLLEGAAALDSMD